LSSGDRDVPGPGSFPSAAGSFRRSETCSVTAGRSEGGLSGEARSCGGWESAAGVLSVSPPSRYGFGSLVASAWESAGALPNGRGPRPRRWGRRRSFIYVWVCYVVVRSPRNFCCFGSPAPGGADRSRACGGRRLQTRRRVNRATPPRSRVSPDCARPGRVERFIRGASRVVRRPGGGIQPAHEVHGPAAQIDDPVDRRPVFGLQGLHGQQLCLCHESSERIVEGVTQIERHFAGGGELSFGVP
jgi:hypothetical protein